MEKPTKDLHQSYIVSSNECGWIVDHKTHINQTYSTVLANKDTAPQNSSTLQYQCRPELFAIHTPFMMDSQFQAQLKCDAPVTQTDAALKNKRKRKRPNVPSEGEVIAAKVHEEVKNILENALKQLVALGRNLGYFTEVGGGLKDNNLVARQAALVEGPGDSLVELCELVKDGGDLAHSKFGGYIDDVRSLTESVVHYTGDRASRVRLLSDLYLIPPSCALLMSDITALQPLTQDDVRYDLIILDPPWENKSVKRKKKYKTMVDEDVLKIPLRDLAQPNALVAMWVTNKQKQQRFVREEVFPQWRVQYEATWYWLKVTTSGQPVCSLESAHSKKPYECLVLGRHNVNSDQLLSSHRVPANRTIISVPCSIHSRKPPLKDLLEQYIPSSGPIKCLEMFARNLLPGFTSWGNEVLKFQHVDFYEEMTKSASQL